MIWKLEDWQFPCYNVNNGRCKALLKWNNSKNIIYEETTNNIIPILSLKRPHSRAFHLSTILIIVIFITQFHLISFDFIKISYHKEKSNDNKVSNNFSMMKLWNFLKSKSIKSRNIKKIQTPYKVKDILEQSSDNDSDKTDVEKEFKYTDDRVRKANSTQSNNSNKSNGSDKPKYYKRDKSLDIIRNNNDEYEVVLPYQRYLKKTK